MKSFAEQLQDYLNSHKSDSLNRFNFLQDKRVKTLGHMSDLLQILGVIPSAVVGNYYNAVLTQHQTVYLLVNKYYKPPR